MSVENSDHRAPESGPAQRPARKLLDAPANLLAGIAGVINRIGDVFNQLSDAAFYFEADAARQYRTLTGVDLGFASKGDLDRYAGTNPKALALAESEEFEDWSGDDDD